MADVDPKVNGTIDLILSYKKGWLTLDQTVDRFSKLTGITGDIAETYIRELKRDNVISLKSRAGSHSRSK